MKLKVLMFFIFFSKCSEKNLFKGTNHLNELSIRIDRLSAKKIIEFNETFNQNGILNKKIPNDIAVIIFENKSKDTVRVFGEKKLGKAFIAFKGVIGVSEKNDTFSGYSVEHMLDTVILINPQCKSDMFISLPFARYNIPIHEFEIEYFKDSLMKIGVTETVQFINEF